MPRAKETHGFEAFKRCLGPSWDFFFPRSHAVRSKSAPLWRFGISHFQRLAKIITNQKVLPRMEGPPPSDHSHVATYINGPTLMYASGFRNGASCLHTRRKLHATPILTSCSSRLQSQKANQHGLTFTTLWDFQGGKYDWRHVGRSRAPFQQQLWNLRATIPCTWWDRITQFYFVETTSNLNDK